MLIHASEEDQDGRYYKKTLTEIDDLSLVRDRIGQDDFEPVEEVADGGDDEQELAEREDPTKEEDEQEEGEREEQPSHPPRSKKQLDMENEWGLHRSRPGSREESGEEDPEESDTDSQERVDNAYNVRPGYIPKRTADGVVAALASGHPRKRARGRRGFPLITRQRH